MHDMGGRQGRAGQGVAWHGSKTSNLSAIPPLDPCSALYVHKY